MFASPKYGAMLALHVAFSSWHTGIDDNKLEGWVASFTSVKPFPQAAAATSHRKAKPPVTQTSCIDRYREILNY